MGYSGSTEFDFDIERYKNKTTGELHSIDSIDQDMKNTGLGDDWLELCYEYQVITLTVEGRSYFQEGRTYGAPENCYPDEGETEITAVIGPDGKDWQNRLSASEVDSITDMIADHVMDGADDYEPDYDDYDDDDYHHNED
jgi:hypothetical protein